MLLLQSQLNKMELEIKLDQLFKIDKEGFICLSGRDYSKQLRPHMQQKGLLFLSKIITTMGERSASAQKLKQVITTPSKFYNSDQRLYLKVNGHKVLGFLKVGQRNLFYHDNMGAIKELAPTCVLDFYVHQSCQRSGIGKEIFEKFLRNQNKSAQKSAYDRPSEKLIGFLKKHYNLSGFIPQNNNYVIFDRFFSKTEKTKVPLSPKAASNKLTISKTASSGSKVESKVNKNTQKVETASSQQKTVSFKPGKDQAKSSFGCPWAIDQKIGFKTTSNSYGNHYRT